MGFCYPTGVRFLPGEGVGNFIEGLCIVYNALSQATKIDPRNSVRLVLARMPAEPRAHETLSTLLPAITEAIESNQFDHVVFHQAYGSEHQEWRLFLEKGSPSWVRAEFDLLESTVQDERLPNTLRNLVDAQALDIAVWSEGYYGRLPLVFLYSRFHEIECGIRMGSCDDKQALFSYLTKTAGSLEAMRQIEAKAVHGHSVERFMRDWCRRIERLC